MFKRILLPAGLLAGTIIGAGVFALPYVFIKAGIIVGLFYLVAFTAVFIIIHSMYSEVILKTPGEHRFSGYAKIYLGNWGLASAILAAVIGLFFVLTTYLVLSSSFMNLIFPKLAGTAPLIFWAAGSLAIFWSLKRLAVSEMITTVSALVLILGILFFGLKWGNLSNLSFAVADWRHLFIPYGAILFALSGRVAIPSVIDYLKKGNSLESAKKVIIIGTIVPAFAYLLFALSAISLSPAVSEDGVSGLIGRIPPWILALFGIFGILSIWDTYIVIGRNVRRSLEYDFKFPAQGAVLVVIFLPLFLYLAGFQNFIKLISLTGGIFIGLEGVLIILMRRKVFKKTRLIDCLLLAIFIGGIIYAIMS